MPLSVCSSILILCKASTYLNILTAHDSTLTIVYPSGPEAAPQALYTIQLPSLPFISLLFINENSIVAAGHDCQPILFEGTMEAGWTQSRSLDDPTKRLEGSGGARTPSASGIGRLNNSEAFSMFRAADSRGVASSAPVVALAGTRITAQGTELLTVHQNTITSVRAFAGHSGDITSVSTTAVDGRLVIWDCASV